MKALTDHVIRWIPIAVAVGFLVLTVSFDVFELPDQGADEPQAEAHEKTL